MEINKEYLASFEEAVNAMYMFCHPIVNDGRLYISEKKAKEFLLEWKKQDVSKVEQKLK